MVDLASKFPSLAVQDPRLTGDIFNFDLGIQERRDHEIDSRIHGLERLVPGNPILGLTSRLGAPKMSKQPVFYMFKVKPLKNYLNTAATATATATTVTIAAADVTRLKQGYHLLVARTREIIRVNAAPAAALPIARGVGEVSGAAMNNGDEMVILGYHAGEGEAKRADISYVPESFFNYITKHHRTWGLTDYEQGSSIKNSAGRRNELRAQNIGETRQVVENSYLFDQRTKFVNEDNKVTFVGNGLDAICTQNENDFGGSVTETKLVVALEPIFRYGPSVRWGLSSPKFIRKLSLALAGDRRINESTVRRAGLRVLEYEAPNGKVNFFHHPLLQDSASTDESALNATCYIVNFDDLRTRTMRGDLNGYFKMRMNVETQGTMAHEDQLIVTFGLEWHFAEHHARFLNA